jgi:tRNA threonylcarbamoyladenosine biosynthesis protein TsaB
MMHSISDSHAAALESLSERVGGPLLALDTSSPSASVCTVGWSQEVLWEVALGESGRPSAALAGCLDAEFSRCDIKPSQLKALVIGTGPGSFTGLRVGLALAKGLALGAGVPLYGISSLALWAASAGVGLVRPILDARRGQFFTGLYRVSEDGTTECIEADSLLLGEELSRRIEVGVVGEPVTFAGDGVELLEVLACESVVKVDTLPRAHSGLLSLSERLVEGKCDAASELVPNYLQITEAERQALLRRQ